MQGNNSKSTQAMPEKPADDVTAASEQTPLVPSEAEFDFSAVQGGNDPSEGTTRELLEHFIASDDVDLDALFDALLAVAEGGPEDPEALVTDGSEMAVDAIVAESFVTVGDGAEAADYHSLESKILALFDAYDTGAA